MRESFYPEPTKPKKPPKVRRRFLYACGIVVLVAALGVGGVYLFTVSGAFAVTVTPPKTKLVSGAEVLKSVVAERMAEHPLLRLLGSDNFFFWRGARSASLTASLVPAVSNIGIDAKYSGRTVAVTAEERMMEGVWCIEVASGTVPAGGCYAFDSHGIFFADAPEIHGSLLLKVTDENPGPRALGARILFDPVWYANFMETLKDLKESGYTVTKIAVRRDEFREWAVTLDSDVEMRFSFDFVPPSFGNALVNLAERFDFSKLSYLDFRVPNRIYYK
jgi:hypothetical protein